MKAVRIASISVAALFILTPCANAQQATTTVSEVPKLQPGSFPHPGTSADVLGIRVGMTVSQAEAIAEKIYGKPADVEKARDAFAYKEVSVRSQPYVLYEEYGKDLAHGGSDSLTLYFLGPVSGNRLYSIDRTIFFNGMQGFDPKKALADPSISALKVSLIKKYGPPSYEPLGIWVLGIWAFTQKSRISGITRNAILKLWYNSPPTQKPHHGLSAYADGHYTVYSGCGTSAGHPSSFLINAKISVNDSDRTKADALTVDLWDPPACVNDLNESIKQLKPDAIKAYKSASAKAPAPPKL
ncbi:MAG TPA: hypothetical protein VFA48_06935 [Gammaproteobacteria bacterium]|nr:hypothetical protein [Gammaproteobacteria bacterium]